MRDLIKDLLESERLSNPMPLLQREPTDLALLAWCSGRMARAQPARGGNCSQRRLTAAATRSGSHPHAAAAAQPAGQCAAAGPPGTAPTVSISRDEGHEVVLEVRDYGNGVPGRNCRQLGFYRPDSARQRSSGGVGLGLYLCRLVAEAHGGQFAIRNANPELAVRITLPINS